MGGERAGDAFGAGMNVSVGAVTAGMATDGPGVLVGTGVILAVASLFVGVLVTGQLVMVFWVRRDRIVREYDQLVRVLRWDESRAVGLLAPLHLASERQIRRVVARHYHPEA